MCWVSALPVCLAATAIIVASGEKEREREEKVGGEDQRGQQLYWEERGKSQGHTAEEIEE